MVRVLFVCLGNICRSPMAHGALRALIEERGLEGRVAVDSCGTSSHHCGEPPDPTMQQVARQVGIALGDLRSRQLRGSDFEQFDILVAMDSANEADILARRPDDAPCEVVRFMSFVPHSNASDVPDPWWAGRVEGFETVRDLVTSGVGPLLDYALDRHRG